jgi:cell division septal protein FtsQ
MNLLAINLRQTHDDFLKKTPVVKSLTLCQKLLDTLEVDVVERTALARIGQSPVWGVDREGRVFSIRPTGRELPAITGYPAGRLSPGAQLNPTAMCAIDVLDAWTRPRLGDQIRIASIDVGVKECLTLFLADGTRVSLAWSGMGTGTPESRTQMERKLAWLAQAARSSALRGRRLSNLDLTFHDQYMPAHEY